MAKRFAAIAGLFFLLLGITGFFTHDLWGIIHFDLVHNVIHLVLGLLGLAAAGSSERAVDYAKWAGFLYVVLGILGMWVPEMFGMMHMENTENVLHLIVGFIGLYLGFTAQTIQTVKMKSKSV